MTRAIVLWGVAGLLGATAGLNAIRLARSADGAGAGQAKALGFESVDDFRTVSALLDTPRLQALNESEIAVLDRYADAKGSGPDFVAGVLGNVADAHLAERLVPVARRLRHRLPRHPLVLELPGNWRSKGFTGAVAALRAGVPGS